MSTNKNKNKKVVTKPVTKPVVEEKDKKALEAPITTSEKPEEKLAEAPTPEVKVEVKEETPVPTTISEEKRKKDKKEAPKVENPTAPVDNTVIIAEVVNPTEEEEKTKPTLVGSIGANLASFGDPKDRLDKNHQIDLMNMIHQEYLKNPNTDNGICKLAKQQFDAMALMSLVQYNAQVAGDLQSLGIQCAPKMAPMIEKMAMELLGIKVTTLPSPNDPAQLMLQFENVPTEVTRIAVQEKKIEDKPIPEPLPELDEKVKIEALQNIFQKKGEKNSMGDNLIKGIEWARKAYAFSVEEKKSVIFANIINKNFGSMLINCFRNMVIGKINNDHSILGAHALMKAWCPNLQETEVAEITKVLASCGIEKRIADWDEKAGLHKIDPVNEFTLVNRNITAGNANKVITGILENHEDVTVDYPDGVGKVNIHPRNIRNTFVAAYGDSDSLMKDKLNEIVKYYITPVMRLSSYVDKSAYSQK